MNHNMEMTEKTTGSGAARWSFYLMGLLILAMGLTLNTKAGLGVSPIISLSYAASVIWNRNFGDMTFVLYGIFVLIQAAIHLREKGKAGRSLLMKDALQFPLSIVFTRFLNVFSVCIPSLEECGSEASGLLGRLGVLMLALIFTGIGAAMSLSMRLVPNPGDGLVQVLADTFGIGTGLMKNCVDAFCIVLSLIMGLLFAGKPVGIGCAMKNAGVGVGIPDTGRVKLVFEKDKKLHIYSGASCIGQGLGTVLTQMVVTNTDLKHEDIVYERSNTWFAPDSGTTSGSRQTLVTGEACRRACDKVMEDRNAGKTIDDVIGKIYYGEYLAKTDPLGANVPNPVSHVAYGYATQMCILDKKTGKIEEMVAAHDVGKAVNPLSCEGQIEGGVVMSIGFALREHYPIDENCKPIDKYGSLGLFRSHEIPKIDAIVVDKPGLNVACGAIGIGEITSIPTAPAIADAYFRWNGERQYSLPLTGTPYERKC